MKKISVSLCLLGAAVLSIVPFLESSAVAEVLKPSVAVQNVVEEVRTTVASNKDKLEASALDQELRNIIEPVFDFASMARSSLAQNWEKATPEQQTEFVELFSDLLARSYLKRIRDNVATSEFDLVEEKTKGKKAIVRTKVTYDKDQTATIDYRMRLKKDSWLVYDVIVENIGLVSNYRSEFASIVKKRKIEGLLSQLRDKKVGVKAGE